MMVKTCKTSPSFCMYLWLRNVPYFVSSISCHFRFHFWTFIFWYLDHITIFLPFPQMNQDCPLTWLKLIWKAVTRSVMYTSANDLAYYKLDMKAPVLDPFRNSNSKRLWPVARWTLCQFQNKSYSSPTTGFWSTLPLLSRPNSTVLISPLLNITSKLEWTNFHSPLLANFDSTSVVFANTSLKVKHQSKQIQRNLEDIASSEAEVSKAAEVLEQISAEGSNHPTLSNFRQHSTKIKKFPKWKFFFNLLGILIVLLLFFWIFFYISTHHWIIVRNNIHLISNFIWPPRPDAVYEAPTEADASLNGKAPPEPPPHSLAPLLPVPCSSVILFLPSICCTLRSCPQPPWTTLVTINKKWDLIVRSMCKWIYQWQFRCMIISMSLYSCVLFQSFQLFYLLFMCKTSP